MFLGALLRGLLCPGLVCALWVGFFCRGIGSWLGAHLGRRAAAPVWQPLIDVMHWANKDRPQGKQRPLSLAAWPVLLGLAALSWASGMLPWPRLPWPAFPSFSGDLVTYLLLLSVPPLARLLTASLSEDALSMLGVYRYASLEIGRLMPLWLAAAALALNAGGLSMSPEPPETLWAALVRLAAAGIALATLPWPLWDRDAHNVPLSALGGRVLALFRAMESLELYAHVGLVALMLGSSALLPAGWMVPAISLLVVWVVLALLEWRGRHLPPVVLFHRYTRWLLPLALLLAVLGWWFG
jgi:formate hydrogenlyase subunit 4